MGKIYDIKFTQKFVGWHSNCRKRKDICYIHIHIQECMRHSEYIHIHIMLYGVQNMKAMDTKKISFTKKEENKG